MSNNADLTEHQIGIASDWMRQQIDPLQQHLFDKAFDVVLEADLLKEQRETETDEKELKRLDKRLRGLENKITPAVKRAALKREAAIIPLVLQYFRETNGDTNITRCIKWVRSNGAGKSIQDAAMRVRIKQVFSD